ncbi:MAG TPA: DNA-binding protein [Thermoplasmata archaeon]|nr:DNA-binding protein [Thermoplasmata archaeon]
MFKKERSIIVAKFTDGEILQNIRRMAEKLNIESAIILNGIGMIENAVIGYYDGEKYVEEIIKEPAEIVSLQGNIGKCGEERIIHAHVGIACRDHIVRGGHLIGGKVKVVNEIALYLLEKIKIERMRKGELMEMELK